MGGVLCVERVGRIVEEKGGGDACVCELKPDTHTHPDTHPHPYNTQTNARTHKHTRKRSRRKHFSALGARGERGVDKKEEGGGSSASTLGLKLIVREWGVGDGGGGDQSASALRHRAQEALQP